MRKKVEFVLEHFNLDCKVKVRYKKMKEHYGETHVKAQHYVIYLRPDIPKFLQTTTLFHELAHVKQYELDGLYMSDELMMFKGERHRGNGSASDYWWYPWEIEARGYEEALLHEWRTHKQKKKN